MQGSYDKALAPLRSLQRRIVVMGTAALLAALLIGVGLAGGITSPLQGLVAGMREVVKGNLRYRTKIEREDEIGFLARSFNDMVDGLEERERIRDTFGRFVSHDVAEAVLTGRVPLEGERRNVSILFQDIRGFTALSERMDPAVLLTLLNQFFTEVVAVQGGPLHASVSHACARVRRTRTRRYVATGAAASTGRTFTHGSGAARRGSGLAATRDRVQSTIE